MVKVKTQYVCTECGADFNKWGGQCSACKAWNTLQEFRMAPKTNVRQASFAGTDSAEIVSLDKVDTERRPRLSIGIDELDRVLGCKHRDIGIQAKTIKTLSGIIISVAIMPAILI